MRVLIGPSRINRQAVRTSSGLSPNVFFQVEVRRWQHVAGVGSLLAVLFFMSLNVT